MVINPAFMGAFGARGQRGARGGKYLCIRIAGRYLKTMPEEVEKFADIARSFCAWAEGNAHNVADARRLLLQLLLQVTMIEEVASADASVAASSEDSESDFARRGFDGWKKDCKRFLDLPFQYYLMMYSPLDHTQRAPVAFDLHDDLADIFGDLWHGLQAYEAGDSEYAADHWVESYRYHWGHHATGALYALDERLRSEME
jgi:hypothetical protein